VYKQLTGYQNQIILLSLGRVAWVCEKIKSPKVKLSLKRGANNNIDNNGETNVIKDV